VVIHRPPTSVLKVTGSLTFFTTLALIRIELALRREPVLLIAAVVAAPRFEELIGATRNRFLIVLSSRWILLGSGARSFR
jgi:hypothetical protein